MLRPAMAPSAEPNRGHPGSDCRLDTEQTVLDDQTPVRGGCELLRGIEEQIGSRLAASDHCCAEQVFAKTSQKAGYLQFLTDLFQAAARRDAGGQCQRIERFANPLDRCKRLMKPGLDHQSDMLCIRGWQRAAPLALDDFEHIRIAHAAEALDENFFGDRISARRQHLGVGSVDDRLAVDQHPIAVGNNQLKSASNHPSRSTETLTPSASRSIRPPSSLV